MLALNVSLSAALGVAGWIGDSSALLANAVDNTSDAVVYALSLFALGRSARLKTAIAKLSGVLLFALAAGVLVDAIRRYLVGSEPLGPAMMGMAVISAIINLVCLLVLVRLKSDDPNIKAASTFSFNDFISNGGIFVAGGLVAWLKSPAPDVLVGAAVAAVAIYGGVEILRDARQDARVG